eukprot:1009715-Pyramimonas_sp.AAC.1
MKLEGGIRRYFCWPPLDAFVTGAALVQGSPVAMGEQVWPMSQSIPMGFSLSLYFEQAANQARLDRQPSLSGSALERSGPASGAQGRNVGQLPWSFHAR